MSAPPVMQQTPPAAAAPVSAVPEEAHERKPLVGIHKNPGPVQYREEYSWVGEQKKKKEDAPPSPSPEPTAWTPTHRSLPPHQCRHRHWAHGIAGYITPPLCQCSPVTRGTYGAIYDYERLRLNDYAAYVVWRLQTITNDYK
jgi:hypothetical protein